MTQSTIVALAHNSGSNSTASNRLSEPQTLAVSTPGTLVSIMIPCCGQLEYTKLCVPALLKHTRPPYELIFLDIGSLDGTSAYLAGLAAAAKVRVEVVRTPTDLGIAQAIQDALRLARGEQPGWHDEDLLQAPTVEPFQSERP